MTGGFLRCSASRDAWFFSMLATQALKPAGSMYGFVAPPRRLYLPAGSKNQTEKLQGAVVAFRAVPGMTAEWFQRIVDCHLARNAALGFSVTDMPYCPLNVKGTRAKVSSTGSGFAVTIESDDPGAAQNVLQRAQALASK